MPLRKKPHHTAVSAAEFWVLFERGAHLFLGEASKCIEVQVLFCIYQPEAPSLSCHSFPAGLFTLVL